MALVYQNLTLEVTPGMIPPVLHVTEYDINMQIDVTFVQRGQPYEIPSGTTAKVEGTLAGHPFRESCTVNGNTVTFILTKNMTAYAGRAWTKIVLTNSTLPVSTCGFWLDCDRAGVEAETVIGAPGFEEQIQDAVDEWLDDHGGNTDVKSIIELSNSITPKISITPNPKTINNVFVNVLGPGKTYLYGTCSDDVRLDYYLDSSNLPDGFSRGSDYYAVVIGTDKDDTNISSYSGGEWVSILTVGTEWKSFTAPLSGGLRISTFLRNGKTYDETMYLVILNKNAYTDMIANGRTDMTTVKNKLTETSLILDGSNLGVNYAAASTETRTFNGLTFTASGGNVTINGTSSGVSLFDMFRKAVSPSATFPFVKGKTYTISFHESDSTPIYKQVEYKATESSGLTSLYSSTGVEDVFTFTMPDCYDFYIRFTCDTSGRTYNDKVVYVDIKENSTQDANTIIVDASGNGDFILLKDGIAAGMKRYGTKVIVKPGYYDLVAEFGKSYLDSLSGNDYGFMLGNGIELIFAPNAYVSFDYDGTNDWVIANFSPFNTANDLGYTIDGLHCTARNCRYILHDDPRPGVKDRYSKNVIRNCYFELFPSTEYPSWVNHQIIGGGLSDSNTIIIENCIFNDHFSGVTRYSSVSYHNSTSGSGSFESRIIVKDSFFADGNILAFEGYGSSTAKTKVIVTNNCFENADTDITYSSANADNMNIYRWNNASR